VVSSGVGGSFRGFVSASHAAWSVVLAANVLVLALGAATTGERARRTARRNAELISEEPALV
jgi:hypothetical protein